jgi:tripartite-type tricarboxylate transporter receptor subunit TctC
MSLAFLLATTILVFHSVVAVAQSDFPDRAIQIVVPVPPGGFADALPRLVAEKLATRWAQAVVVVNRPGAALNIGAATVAKAAPDGYTLLATPAGPIATNRFLFSTLGYDPDAFVPVTVMAKGPFLLVARPGLPVSTLPELIAYAKANPGKVTFASSGVGSPPHLAMEVFAQRAGIRLLHVPFQGLAPAMTAVMAGQVDMMFHDFPSTFPQIRAGMVKPLGVGGAERLPLLPKLPAMAETVPGFSSGYWYAIVAPPGTPSRVAEKLSSAVAEALRSPDIANQLRDYAVTAVGSTPAEAATFFKRETDMWREVVASAGIKAK